MLPFEKKLYLIPSKARRQAPCESKFIVLLHAKHMERARIISTECNLALVINLPIGLVSAVP